MITDSKLTEISIQLDMILMELANEHKIPMLELSSIALARLMRLTEEFNEGKEFKQLMGEVIVSSARHNMTPRTLQ